MAGTPSQQPHTMAQLVANSKDFFARLKTGDVATDEIRERLYIATLYVIVVAYVLGGLLMRTVVTHGPTLLHFLKKTLTALTNAIPDSVKTEPHQ